MALISGFGTVLGIGAESSYGSAAARSKWYRVERCDIQAAVRREGVATLGQSSGSANRAEAYDAEETVRGSIVIPASYQDQGLWYKFALNGTPATAGAGPYGHTTKLALALQTGLTMEMILGNSGNSEVFLGMRVDTLEWSVEPGGYAKMTIGAIGQAANNRGSAGTPSFGTPYRVLHHHAGQLSFDGFSYTVGKFSVKLNNKLAPVMELGSLSTTSPERGDYCEVTIEAEVLYRDDELYKSHRDGTQGDVAITFTDGVNAKSLAWTLHNAVIHECTNPFDGVGVRKQRVVWRGYSDGTDEGLQVLITNAQSSAVG